MAGWSTSSCFLLVLARFTRLGNHGSKPWIIFWSMNFFDPNSNFLILDQKFFQDFLIRIKKNKANFWSGSKKIWHIFDPDQKIFMWFLIRIKKISCNFWSGSKNFHGIFDPDQKIFMKFLIRIKKIWCKIWSRSKILLRYLIRIMAFSWSGSWIMNHFWSRSKKIR